MAGRGSAKGEHRGGRKKGTPNKFTAQLKDVIRQAFENAGGVDYLKKQAEENPTAFMTLLGKILPQDVNLGGQKDNPVITKNPDETLKKTNTLLEKLNARIKSLGETGK